MKKISSLIFAVLLVIVLSACAAETGSNEDQVITRGSQATQSTTQATTGPEETAGKAVVPTFSVEGVAVVPGMEFDASKLPEALSTYSAPSCAIDGSDNTYSYTGFEITTMDDGKTELVYSIFLLDSQSCTEQGLLVGDKIEKAVELYGDNYQEEGTAYSYTYENGLRMSIIAQEGIIQSIELCTAV